METIIQIFFGLNALFAFSGWLAWNGIMFSFHKDENEKSFNLNSYALETYDNWIASLFLIPVMLIFGYLKLDIKITDVAMLDWSDCYYPLSGFAVEAIKMIYKKWKSK